MTRIDLDVLGIHPRLVGEFLARRLDLFPLQTFTGRDPTVVVAVVSVFFIGLSGAHFGYRRYQKGQLIEETETAPIGSVTTGRVGITGTVRPVEGAPNAPFTGDKCVLYNYQVTDTIEKKRDDNGHMEVETERKRQEWESKSVEYYVEDDTGTALISSEDGVGHSISSENSDTFRKRRHQPIDDLRFTREDESLTPRTKQRSYTQSYLPVGEDVNRTGRFDAQDLASESDGRGRREHDRILVDGRIDGERERSRDDISIMVV